MTIADANAIEPFSYGRAQLANGASQTVRIEGGWSQDRELYHVVRGTAITGAASTPFVYGSDSGVLENLFSNTGWVCTNATAQTDIAGAGFWPLQHTGTTAGNCGVPNATTNDTITQLHSHGVGEGVTTSTNASYSGGAVHVTVTSDDASTPTGSVQIVVADPVDPDRLEGGVVPRDRHARRRRHRGGEAAGVGVGSAVVRRRVPAEQLRGELLRPAATRHSARRTPSSSAKVKAAKVGTSVKASAKPKTLANATGKSKVTVTVKAASGSAKPSRQGHPDARQEEVSAPAR